MTTEEFIKYLEIKYVIKKLIIEIAITYIIILVVYDLFLNSLKPICSLDKSISVNKFSIYFSSLTLFLCAN